jgi:hypothetical protein
LRAARFFAPFERMMAARSSFDADQPDELPPRDDEPPSDEELPRKQDPLLHMARNRRCSRTELLAEFLSVRGSGEGEVLVWRRRE